MDKPRKRENAFLSLALNLVIPIVILTKFSGDAYLGPIGGLLVALAVPLVYGLHDFLRRRNFNLFSALGFVGILLTGGVGLFRLDPKWIAVREAAVPLLIGLGVIVSLKTPFPLVKRLLQKIIASEEVADALRKKGKLQAYERRLVYATFFVAGSFFLSAVLNFVLARIIVVSMPGTSEFNEELGKMTAISFPVITIPMMVMLFLVVQFIIIGIRRLTGMDLKSILNPSIWGE